MAGGGGQGAVVRIAEDIEPLVAVADVGGGCGGKGTTKIETGIGTEE